MSRNIPPNNKRESRKTRAKVRERKKKSEKSEAAAAEGRIHTYQGNGDFDQPLHSSLQPTQCWCTARLYVQSLGDGQLLLGPPQALDCSP